VDYYPFGATLPCRSYNANASRYTYNGKEYDKETGYLDYGERTMEDLGGVNAAMTVIGAPMQIRGMQAVRVLESNNGWSAFSRSCQKQIAGTEGGSSFIELG